MADMGSATRVLHVFDVRFEDTDADLKSFLGRSILWPVLGADSFYTCLNHSARLSLQVRKSMVSGAFYRLFFVRFGIIKNQQE